jgi:hypothetical protein
VTIDRNAWSLPGIVAPAAGVLINLGDHASIGALTIRGNSITYASSLTRGDAAIYCRRAVRATIRDFRIVANVVVRSGSKILSLACLMYEPVVGSNKVVE